MVISDFESLYYDPQSSKFHFLQKKTLIQSKVLNLPEIRNLFTYVEYTGWMYVKWMSIWIYGMYEYMNIKQGYALSIPATGVHNVITLCLFLAVRWPKYQVKLMTSLLNAFLNFVERQNKWCFLNLRQKWTRYISFEANIGIWNSTYFTWPWPFFWLNLKINVIIVSFFSNDPKNVFPTTIAQQFHIVTLFDLPLTLTFA